MHLHGPSEHTVKGIYYPIEIHLVHLHEGVATADGPTKALVLGVFLTTGKANSFFEVLTAQPSSLLIPFIPKSKCSGPLLYPPHMHTTHYIHITPLPALIVSPHRQGTMKRSIAAIVSTLALLASTVSGT